MARRGRRQRAEAPGASGFLVVDKPPGWTSHDVVETYVLEEKPATLE